MSAATVAEILDRQLAGWKPSRIVYATALGLVGLGAGAGLLRKGRLLKRLDQLKWRFIRVVGAVLVSKKISEAAEGIKFKKVKAGDREFLQLPATGMAPTDIMALCKLRHGELDSDYSHGECSGMVYHGGAAHTQLVNDTMAYFQWSNPLHVDCFGAVRKMEAEIVAMTLALYHGEAAKSGSACGSLTSGGTESIGMAMRSYREWGRATRGLKTFSIVAPITIHPAFDKAADYYGMDIIKVPINPDTGVVDPEELEKYIRHDTVVICGSTPCFPTGTVDRIADLAQVAKRNGVGLHVDSCLGGFIMPFLEDAGFDQPITDFRVDGVTTISADTHKYGFAPKGTSVVLYHSKDLRRYQFFAMSEWPGGIYASPAAAGSKAGNVIAGTWAAMVSIGQKGYVESCKRIVTARKTVEDGVKAIPGMRIIGFPAASVLAFTSDRVDCFELNDQLVKKGWMLNPLQFPSGLQISVTMLHAQPGVAERLVSDIKQIVTTLEAALPPGAKKVPEKGSSLYGSQQRVADRTIINDVLRCFCDKYYVP